MFGGFTSAEHDNVDNCLGGFTESSTTGVWVEFVGELDEWIAEIVALGEFEAIRTVGISTTYGRRPLKTGPGSKWPPDGWALLA